MSIQHPSLDTSLEHRRLRFSFQINDFKDPTWKNQGHCFAPVSGGGGFLKKADLGVNRAFSAILRTVEAELLERKKPSEEARGFPLVSFPTIRLERGDYVEPAKEARSF